MERFLNKHIAVIQIVGGVIATCVTLTVFAYTSFATKTEVQQSIAGVKDGNQDFRQWIEKRLDRIEEKQDQLYDKLRK